MTKAAPQAPDRSGLANTGPSTGSGGSKGGSALDRRRLRRVLARSDRFLALFAVLFLIAYAWPILQPSVGPDWKHLFGAIQFAAWLVFALDYAARLYVAKDRKQYFSKHLLDLMTSCSRCCGRCGCCVSSCCSAS